MADRGPGPNERPDRVKYASFLTLTSASYLCLIALKVVLKAPPTPIVERTLSRCRATVRWMDGPGEPMRHRRHAGVPVRCGSGIPGIDHRRDLLRAARAPPMPPPEPAFTAARNPEMTDTVDTSLSKKAADPPDERSYRRACAAPVLGPESPAVTLARARSTKPWSCRDAASRTVGDGGRDALLRGALAESLPGAGDARDRRRRRCAELAKRRHSERAKALGGGTEALRQACPQRLRALGERRPRRAESAEGLSDQGLDPRPGRADPFCVHRRQRPAQCPGAGGNCARPEAHQSGEPAGQAVDRAGRSGQSLGESGREPAAKLADRLAACPDRCSDSGGSPPPPLTALPARLIEAPRSGR